MSIVIDTHALFWYLTKDKRLSRTAEKAIATAARRFVPTIVLLEVLYLMQRQGIEKNFRKILKVLKKETPYVITSLDLILVETIVRVSKKLEMHDRIIVATAKLLKAPIITRDATIQQTYKNTIW